MKNLKNVLFLVTLASLMIFFSCSEDDPGMDEIPNEAPTVDNPIADQNFDEGFGSTTIDLGNVFSDEESNFLSFAASSSNQSVVSVSLSGKILTVTEQGTGSSTITVTAEDDEGESVSDQFLVSVSMASNSIPTVENPIEDISLTVGFGTENISLIGVFNDVETMMLQFAAESSETGVVTVSVNMADLTISEVGLGTSIITVTAMDTDGGSVSDEFEVSVVEGETETCTNDNSMASDLGTCDESPVVSNTYNATISGDTRTISTNGIPNHDFRNQNPTADELNSEPKTYEVDATPSKAANTSSILTQDFRPKIRFGVALNGVVLDPAPAEPFIFTDNDGEYNWDWVFEPTNNTQEVGLDCAMAHVQPDGTYHYHGDMVEYANTIADGLGDGTFTPSEPIHLGWAADGFPILYKFGPDASGNLKLLESSYQVKSGDRPGDGVTAPCGTYNGKYTNDYEFVSEAGDLDECNGVDREINIDGETFSYFYVVTDAFPVIPRCFVGTADASFNLGGGGGMGGG